MAISLVATLEPARLAVRLAVSGIPAAADTYTIARWAPSGSVAGVRGATAEPVTGPTAVARDYEIPFDLDIVYVVTAYDGATVVGEASVPFTIEYGECEAWLVDLARPTNSLPVMIESMRELAFDAPSGVHRVLNRRAPVMTLLPAWTPTTELVLLTGTLVERDQVRILLGAGYPVLLRTIPELGIGNMYLGVTGFVEERIQTLGVPAERRFRASCVQVERPDPAIYVPAAPNSYANVKATYTTYAALKVAVGSYDELAYTWTGPGLGPLLPWLPDDV